LYVPPAWWTLVPPPHAPHAVPHSIAHPFCAHGLHARTCNAPLRGVHANGTFGRQPPATPLHHHHPTSATTPPLSSGGTSPRQHRQTDVVLMGRGCARRRRALAGLARHARFSWRAAMPCSITLFAIPPTPPPRTPPDYLCTAMAAMATVPSAWPYHMHTTRHTPPTCTRPDSFLRCHCGMPLLPCLPPYHCK